MARKSWDEGKLEALQLVPGRLPRAACPEESIYRTFYKKNYPWHVLRDPGTETEFNSRSLEYLTDTEYAVIDKLEHLTHVALVQSSGITSKARLILRPSRSKGTVR